MVVDILGLNVEIGHFPVEVQSAIAVFCEAESDFDSFQKAQDLLIDTLSAIDEANDFDTNYVSEVEDLLCF
jgi:hypothetical protein